MNDRHTDKAMHELLVSTRNEIARRGHAQGVLQDEDGRVCLYGGFFKAEGAGFLKAGVPDVEGFATALGFEKPDPTERVYPQPLTNPTYYVLGASRAEVAIAWNNAPGRTEEEVLARLDEAIARTAPAPEDPLVGVQEEVLV